MEKAICRSCRSRSHLLPIPGEPGEVGCEFIHLFLSFFFFYLSIFGCIGSSLLRAGFSLVVASGGYSLLRRAGFPLRWLLLLWSTGSRCAGFSSCSSQALECRLSSCGARA